MASAILGNGDAVVVEADLSTRLVHDGADPNDPPAEGELTTVDSVVVTPTGRVFVSTCCEPVPGSWFEVDASGEVISDVRFGHALALSPDGTRLASVGGTGITVTDLDGAVVASTDLSASPVYRQPESVMWLDDDDAGGRGAASAGHRQRVPPLHRGRRADGSDGVSRAA